ncbi:hypothetical protein A2U01_0114582, partial [Trifolium medium]|nr:hypothetical protein [Trifolium medium]
VVMLAVRCGGFVTDLQCRWALGCDSQFGFLLRDLSCCNVAGVCHCRS